AQRANTCATACMAQPSRDRTTPVSSTPWCASLVTPAHAKRWRGRRERRCCRCRRTASPPTRTSCSRDWRQRRTTMHAWPQLDRLARRESLWCLRLNSACTRRAVRGYFSTVSRLGDGMFWYALMLALPLFDGARGLAASAHLALTGG